MIVIQRGVPSFGENFDFEDEENKFEGNGQRGKR